MDRMMERFMEEAIDQLKDRDGPVYYGFSISVGSDGKPMVQEFGNVKPSQEGPCVKDEIEPLVDVVEKDDVVTVYAELPGVEKEAIDLSLSEDCLTISAQGTGRRYLKEASFPAKVKPDTAKACYKNGILQVTLEKATKQQKGKRLKVD